MSDSDPALDPANADAPPIADLLSFVSSVEFAVLFAVALLLKQSPGERLGQRPIRIRCGCRSSC